MDILYLLLLGARQQGCWNTEATRQIGSEDASAPRRAANGHSRATELDGPPGATEMKRAQTNTHPSIDDGQRDHRHLVAAAIKGSAARRRIESGIYGGGDDAHPFRTRASGLLKRRF